MNKEVSRLNTISLEMEKFINEAGFEKLNLIKIKACFIALCSSFIQEHEVWNMYNRLEEKENENVKCSEYELNYLNSLKELLDDRYLLQSKNSQLFFKQARAVEALIFALKPSCIESVREVVYEASFTQDPPEEFFKRMITENIYCR